MNEILKYASQGLGMGVGMSLFGNRDPNLVKMGEPIVIIKYDDYLSMKNKITDLETQLEVLRGKMKLKRKRRSRKCNIK